jgi:hypothetical protein
MAGGNHQRERKKSVRKPKGSLQLAGRPERRGKKSLVSRLGDGLFFCPCPLRIQQ